jgi:hypothetical protein
MSDLRRLLETARGDLPPAPAGLDLIIEAGRRGVRRRRLARGFAVAGAAVAVAAVVTAGLPLFRGTAPAPHQKQPAPPAVAKAQRPVVPPFSYTFAKYAVGDFRVDSPLESTPGYESAVIFRDHALLIGEPDGMTVPAGSLTVYRPGVFDPSAFTSGTPVTVSGHAGFAKTFVTTEKVPSATGKGKRTVTIHSPGIAWQFAPDSWAVISARGDGNYGISAATVKQLADRFTSRTPTPARLPYRMRYTPPGWALVSAGRVTFDLAGDSETHMISEAYLAKKATLGAFRGLSGRIDFEDATWGAISINVSRKETEGQYPHPFKTKCQLSVSGLGAFCDLPIKGSDYYVEVFDASRTLSVTEVEKITDGLDFDNVTKPATWHPATD